MDEVEHKERIRELIEKQEEVNIYKAASDETRMRILRFLYLSPISHSIEDIAKSLKLREEKTRESLYILESSGLVESYHKEGEKRYKTTWMTPILFEKLGTTKEELYRGVES